MSEKNHVVYVDRRYFVYERQINDAGEVVPVRKGVIRATSNIVKNDTIATGEGGTTTFYQTFGGGIKDGMTIQEKVDWGIGVSLLAGTDISVLGEFSVGMWLGNAMKIPYGTKLYVRLDYPLSKMEDNNIILTDTEGNDMQNMMVAIGVSKDFYFMRMVSLSPFLGVTTLIETEATKEVIAATNKITSNVEVGANLSIGILDNAQIIGRISYNALKGSFFGDPLSFGVGLRYQF